LAFDERQTSECGARRAAAAACAESNKEAFVSRINIGRVLVGGLLAGLIYNVGEAILNAALMKEPWEAMLKSMNLDPAKQSLPIYIVGGFLLGIGMIWLYAAIRPRFGAGPKTAIIAGLAVWFFASLYTWSTIIAAGMFNMTLATMCSGWALFELLIGAIAGAWVYREEATVSAGAHAHA
jgi:uncharacterized membrane protein